MAVDYYQTSRVTRYTASEPSNRVNYELRVVHGSCDDQEEDLIPVGPSAHKPPDIGTYFAWMTGTRFIKIGMSAKNVVARVRDVNCGNPIPLVLLCVIPANEGTVHHWFSDCRVQTPGAGKEWFTISSKMIEVMCTHKGWRNRDQLLGFHRGRADQHIDGEARCGCVGLTGVESTCAWLAEHIAGYKLTFSGEKGLHEVRWDQNPDSPEQSIQLKRLMRTLQSAPLDSMLRISNE